MDTGQAAGAFALVIENLDSSGLRFRVGAPFTPQGAAFEENRGADSRAVIGAEFLDIEYDSFAHSGASPL